MGELDNIKCRVGKLSSQGLIDLGTFSVINRQLSCHLVRLGAHAHGLHAGVQDQSRLQRAHDNHRRTPRIHSVRLLAHRKFLDRPGNHQFTWLKS